MQKAVFKHIAINLVFYKINLHFYQKNIFYHYTKRSFCVNIYNKDVVWVRSVPKFGTKATHMTERILYV